MADILLSRSAEPQVIECTSGARFVFLFPSDVATLSRSGDDLVLNVEGGSTITLSDFYGVYHQQDMPSFAVDGAEVAGNEFFEALEQPDLMPAAGPEPANDSHYQEWSNLELLGGLDRLGGLDVGWPDGMPQPDTDGAAAGADIDWAVDIVPTVPVDPPTDVPIIDPEGNPVRPDIVVDSLTVHESALANGIRSRGADEIAVTSGSMDITARDGVYTITVTAPDGQSYVVYQDDNRDPDAVTGTIVTDTVWVHGNGSEGYLSDFAYTRTGEGTGQFTYNFHLVQSTQEHAGTQGENAIAHRFIVTVDDKDVNHHVSDIDSADILVTIVDDVPVAESDSSTGVREAVVVAESAQGLDAGVDAISGNVLDNDSYGADGRAADYVDWGTAVATRDGATVNLAEYGKLTQNEDGSWSFDLDQTSPTVKMMDENSVVTVEVPYTIIDADGDTAQASLVFNIDGSDNATSITPDPDPTNPDPTDPDPTYPDDPTVDNDPAVNGDELTVYDSGLAGGTQAGQVPTVASGSMSILAPDVLASVVLTYKGQDYELISGTPSAIKVDTGTLTASYANGKLSYTYTLDSVASHDKDSDSSSYQIAVTVKDSDGDTDSATITVGIMDDKPFAKDDFAGTVTEDALATGDVSVLSGNVITGTADSGTGAALVADIPGADTLTGTVEWDIPEGWSLDPATGGVSYQTGYGLITLNSDGSYSFALDRELASVRALTDNLDLSVDYTITDKDGDTSTATLTLTIDGEDHTPEITITTPETADGVLVVDEGNLKTEGALGSHANTSGAETASGSLTILAEDGLGTVVVGGETVYKNGLFTAATIKDGTLGELAITGLAANGDSYTLSYIYTLLDNASHDAVQGDNQLAENALRSFTVTATDVDGGETASASIKVDIVDDVPVAVNDNGGTVTEDALATNDVSVLSGSVVENDTPGADGLTGTVAWTVPSGWTQVEGNTSPTYQTGYGEITLNDNGSYSFALGRELASVRALTDNLDLSVDYTITDKDGDTSTATLKLTIDGENHTPSITTSAAALFVDEGDLNIPDKAVGSHAEKPDAVTASGSLTITAEDGLGTVTVGGVTVCENGTFTGATIKDSTLGQLAITGLVANGDSYTLSYTYTLLDNTSHDAVQGDNLLAENALRSFTVTATDVDGGETASASIKVDIVDDVPVFAADSANADEPEDSGKGYVQSVTGDFSINFGADGKAAVYFTVDGKSGTLENGSLSFEVDNGTLVISPTETAGKYEYSYVPDDGDTFSARTFTVTAHDADGDTDTIQIVASRDYEPDIIFSAIPNVAGENIIVDEGALLPPAQQTDHHVDHGKSGTGAFSVDLHGENGTITLSDGTNSFAITANGNTAVTPADAELSVHGVKLNGFAAALSDGVWNITYDYELAGAQIHSGAEDNLSGTITITAADSSNPSDTTISQINLQVHDDGVTVVSEITMTALSTVEDNLVRTSGMDTLVFTNANVHETNATAFQDDLSQWDGAVTISAGVMKFSERIFENGVLADFTPEGLVPGAVATVMTSNSSRQGALTVASNSVRASSFEEEIAAGLDGDATMANLGEAVIFDLGEKLAYGVSIGFGAFYIPASDTGDGAEETAAVVFYRNNEIVGWQLYTSNDVTGDDAKIGDFVIGGFDKVAIAAVNNGSNSDFTIKTMDFTTLPASIAVLRGTVAGIGADMASNTIPEFSYSSTPTTVNVRLSNSDNSTTDTTATITLTNGKDSSMLEGSTATEKLFTAFLDNDTGEWTFYLYKNFQVQNGDTWGDFQLQFSTQDAEGDVGIGKVTIDTTLLESGYMLFGDSELSSTVREDLGISADETTPMSATSAEILQMSESAREDWLESLETAEDGTDMLFSSLGDDIIFAQGGDDYLAGVDGHDILLAGSGNDLIVYDSSDALICGGEGIDFLLGDSSTGSLDSLLGTGGNVQNVEVLIKGDVESLTSMGDLNEAGIYVKGNTLYLDSAKWDGADGDYTNDTFGCYSTKGNDTSDALQIEVTNITVDVADAAFIAAQLIANQNG